MDGAQYVADAQRGLLAELGEPGLARAALDEDGPQRLLQFLDLHRQSRLRDGTGSCRASEVVVRCQGIEIVQLSQGNFCHQNNLSQQLLKSILPDWIHWSKETKRLESREQVRPKERRSWMTLQNVPSPACMDPRIATGGLTRWISRCSIGIRRCLIRWGRTSTMPRSSRRST